MEMNFNEIDKGLATLIAASIAAIISILTFLLTLYFNRKSEVRAARRKTLEVFIYDVADSIHQLIAISIVHCFCPIFPNILAFNKGYSCQYFVLIIFK